MTRICLQGKKRKQADGYCGDSKSEQTADFLIELSSMLLSCTLLVVCQGIFKYPTCPM